MVDALEARPSRLLDIDGVGPVLAARLIGRCGRASRFRTADAFASYAGTDGERIRGSPAAATELNSALHLVAVTQVRWPTATAAATTNARSATATHKEAIRLKIAGRVWRPCSPMRQPPRHQVTTHAADFPGWVLTWESENMAMPTQTSPGHPSTRRYSDTGRPRRCGWFASCVRSWALTMGPSNGGGTLGYGTESVRAWVRQGDIDGGGRPGTTTGDRERLKALGQEVRELRRANAILKSASAFFAAELDRPHR